MNLDELLARAVEAGASDIHLKVGQPPMIRVDGAIGRDARHSDAFDR